MRVTVLQKNGGSDELALSTDKLATPMNTTLLHQVMTSYQANGHVPTAKQKNRSEVSGGGSKPWRQKGTGRARAGTIRSPLWRGGGVTFAARPVKTHKKINRRVFRRALAIIFSELLRQERLVVVDNLNPDAPKTALMKAQLAAWGELDRLLLISEQWFSDVHLAVRNLPDVAYCDVDHLNLMWLVGAKRVYITAAALHILEGRLQ